ncbi:MAG: hypothetical protein QOG14_4006, partial [Mycobacterium sp.]|nr:hypothetical protein [Mycobacterium sp.]
MRRARDLPAASASYRGAAGGERPPVTNGAPLTDSDRTSTPTHNLRNAAMAELDHISVLTTP